MSFNVEAGFISKLLQTKDIVTVKDNQIKATYFSGESRLAYQFIYDTVLNTGEVPTVRAFQRKFPRYKLETVKLNGEVVVGTEENLKFWCDELRLKVKHNTIADLVDRVAVNLQDFKTEEAYAALKQTIAFVENEVAVTSDVDLTKGTEDRKRAYLDRKNNKGMRGIPTGIRHLDYILKGLEKETLTTLIANTGVGKAITMETPVLTEQGFVPMRDIQLGTKVCARNGLFYPVTAIYPQGNKEVYRVSFEDGTHVDCCKEHLWTFKTIDDLSRNREWRVKTLEQIMNEHPIRRGRSYNLCIPVNEPVMFRNEQLPIDPYVLGCLLGDGGFTTDRISFTNPEKDIINRVNIMLLKWGEFKLNKATDCQYLFLSGDPKCNKLYRALKELGLIGLKSKDKFIPKEYLNSSLSCRDRLIRGLIDTDGSIDSKGHTSFSTKSERLANDIMYLSRSLGIRCTMSVYDRKEKGIDYVVRFKTDMRLFSSDKHYERYSNRTIPNRKNNYEILKIVSIEKLGYEEEMQCITVSSPDHTFICGDFIVTHNTWFEILIGANCQLQNYRVLQFVTEMSEEIMRDRYEAVLFAKCYKTLNYNAFKSGALSLEVEKQYFEFLENDLPNFEPLIIATATGVMGVSAAIDKYKPDIVLIDSAYLMEDDQGAKDDWLRVAHITRDLKKLAKRTKIPIFINTQADKNTSKKTGPELGSIMYTQAIGQDSDNVLALYRDEIMINDREMGLKVLKQREGTLGKLTLNWDFDTMNFSEIYMQQTDDDSEIPDNTLSVLDDE